VNPHRDYYHPCVPHRKVVYLSLGLDLLARYRTIDCGLSRVVRYSWERFFFLEFILLVIMSRGDPLCLSVVKGSLVP
jgi:hypothetical protein